LKKRIFYKGQKTGHDKFSPTEKLPAKQIVRRIFFLRQLFSVSYFHSLLTVS